MICGFQLYSRAQVYIILEMVRYDFRENQLFCVSQYS